MAHLNENNGRGMITPSITSTYLIRYTSKLQSNLTMGMRCPARVALKHTYIQQTHRAGAHATLCARHTTDTRADNAARQGDTSEDSPHSMTSNVP
jgi:hypothetical protein